MAVGSERRIAQLEHRLAEAQERIRQLELGNAPDNEATFVNEFFEQHCDPVFFLDVETGDICWVNSAGLAFYGYSRRQMMQMHITDLNTLSREISAGIICQIRDRSRSRFIVTHRLADGTLKNVEVYSFPVQLGGRELLCSFIKDISALHDASISMEKNAAMLEQVLSSMDIVPFLLHEEDGQFLVYYLGITVSSVTGYPVDTFYKDSHFWASRIHPDDRNRVMTRFRRLHKTVRTRCEYRWQVADGSYRWFNLSMRLAPCDTLEAPATNCVSGIFWDITERKLTEQALLDREEQYRTVADFTYDWEFWVGPEGNFLYVSPSFERVTGYKSQELKANPDLLFDTIVHPQDRTMVRRYVLDTLLSAEPVAFDFRIITREGDIRWIGHISQPVQDDKGDPLGRRASNRDISDLKATMKALEDKNEFVKAMMDNSPASIYAKDVNGRYLFGNTRFFDYAGAQSKEVLGKTDYGVFPNAVAELFRNGDFRVLETNQPFFEEMTLSRDGEIEHWTSSKFPLTSAEGEVLGVCGMSFDVTEWREAEAEKRRMALAVEHCPVSIAMADTQGKILSVNPCFCRTSGYDALEIVGRDIFFMSADAKDALQNEIWDVLNKGDGWQGEVRNVCKDGSVIWESCSISPVRNDGELVNFVVIKDDVTERKRVERLERDVERIVRHDLKSPLMSFVWVPRSLRKQDNLTEKQKILLGEMEESAHRMLRMINLSLDLFRMEEGTYQFEPEDLNVIRILHNVHRDLESVLRARRVRLDVRVDGMPCSNGTCRVVRGEELLFHSMLANIVRNAVESSSAGDTVTVDCCFGSQAEIRVHNTGLVPEEIKENFFDKYVTCGKKFGTGLGTYSARLSAETQGGTLSMSSEKGKGTTVLLSFPSPDGSGRW